MVDEILDHVSLLYTYTIISMIVFNIFRYPTTETEDDGGDQSAAAGGGQTDRSDAAGSADGGNMTEKDLREAGFVIDIFGLPLVSDH